MTDKAVEECVWVSLEILNTRIGKLDATVQNYLDGTQSVRVDTESIAEKEKEPPTGVSEVELTIYIATQAINNIITKVAQATSDLRL